MSNILQTILNTKAEEVAALRKIKSLTVWRNEAEVASKTRNFVGAIKNKIQQKCPAVIAEIKKASPSKGVISKNFDPKRIARLYAENGAACLSILTDQKFFQGSAEHLQQARAACELPVLRKDFIVDETQIYEARIMGADCILLIAAALSLEQMKNFEVLAYQLNMAVLVEVHNKQELDFALQLTTPLIGINNRDLTTFHMDLNNTLSLLPHVPKDRTIVTESGILCREDVKLMNQNQVHTFLVGEAFMRNENPGLALNELFSTHASRVV